MLDFIKNLGKKKLIIIGVSIVVVIAVILTAVFWPFGGQGQGDDTSGDNSAITTTGTAGGTGIEDGTTGTSGSNGSTDATAADTTTGGKGEKPTGANTTAARPTEGNRPTPGNTKVFDVAKFGAKGDGVTDDGIAIANCVREACRDDAQHKVVKFKPNATYRIKSLPDTHKTYKSVFQIIRADNVTIEGKNTTLLMKAPLRVAYVNESNNVVIKGFNVDYDPKPFALGYATKVDAGSSHPSITFRCDYDLGFKGTVRAPQSDYFAFRNRKDERLHFFIEKMTNNGDGTYTFYFIHRDRVAQAKVGDEFILPVYGSSHLNGAFTELKANHNVTMQDITINALPDFGIGARRNTGKMLFKNIKFMPAKGSKIYLTTWRDGFHIKDNTAEILWDHCYIGPLGDDAFNIASVTCTIDSYNSSARILNAIPDEDISTRENLAVGDEVIIYDNRIGLQVGYAKIEKVISSGSGISIKIDRDLPVKKGQVLGIYSFNKNFKVKDSYIEGTVRVRSSGTFENCKFNVFWVRVENDMGIEGPIPKDILFKNCEFRTPYNTNPEIFYVGTNTTSGGPAQYKCKNIVLDRCRFINGRYYAQPGNELKIR